MSLEITEENFEEVVLSSDQPVLVDFWAEWCGPCVAIAPTIDEISNTYEEDAVVGKVNVDSNSELSTRYGIRSIPTLLIFKGGKVVDKLVGMHSKDTISEALNEQIKA